MAATSAPSIKLPPDLHVHFQAWGPAMQARAEAGYTKWWRQRHDRGQIHGRVLPPRPITLGTDCSGADAPVFGLRALGVAHRHLFACDSAEHARTFISHNTAPAGPLYHDIVRRPHTELPAHDMYVAGFSCKPFSRLHHGTRFFKEREAATFAAVLSTLRCCTPTLAILENVVGIQRVMPRILSRLRQLKVYDVYTHKVCPTEFGEPVRRPRVYFILVHKDRARLDYASCQ